MMAKKEIPEQLSPNLVQFFEGEKLVLLTTIEWETKTPNVTAISWVKAVDEKHIRFSVTNQSRLYKNIEANPNVVLTVIANETVYSIHGMAKILEEKMDGVAIKLAKIELEVSAVFESMFWGAKITKEPEYVKTYNPKKAKELDEQVYTALMS